MIQTIPKCPMCKGASYTKFHVIIEFKNNKHKREKLIGQIQNKQIFLKKMLLNLDIKIDNKLLMEIISYIVETMKACGQVIVIKR
jgi:hypothetical protein